MSMYNMVFGRNQAADAILATLGLSRGDVGRFRDAFVAKGEICIYTRNGGGNRDDYKHVFDALAQHPCYLRDVDDDFDCTYATIFFKFPDEHAEDLRKLDSGEPFDPSARWQQLLASLKGER